MTTATWNESSARRELRLLREELARRQALDRAIEAELTRLSGGDPEVAARIIAEVMAKLAVEEELGVIEFGRRQDS